MLTLYRTSNSSLADAIEEALQEMVMAHRTVTLQDDRSPASNEPLPFSKDQDLPVIYHGSDIISGEDALRDYVEELRHLMADWDRFQSDACYIEEDGTIC